MSCNINIDKNLILLISANSDDNKTTIVVKMYHTILITEAIVLIKSPENKCHMLLYKFNNIVFCKILLNNPLIRNEMFSLSYYIYR